MICFQMVQRLSTGRSSLETRHYLLEKIARDNGIIAQIEHGALDKSRKVEFSGERRNVILQRQLQIHEESYDKFKQGEDARGIKRSAVQHNRNESWDEQSADDSDSDHREEDSD